MGVCFSPTDELISEIHGDINEADAKLDLPENKVYKDDNFFLTRNSVLWQQQES